MTKEIYSIDKIRSILKKVLKNTKVDKAILFGSYAKGSANENSDIDLLIDSNNKIVGFEIFGILQTLTNSFKKEIDLIEKKEIILR